MSWLRAKDTSVLSVGQHIFSSDKRMSVKLESLSSPFVSIWTLLIDSVSVKDAFEIPGEEELKDGGVG